MNRQVWITRVGGPAALEARQAPDPEPDAGELLVRVEAAGINFADVLARRGMYPDAPSLPFVPGYEVAGVVERLGPDVIGFREGDRIVCVSRFGGYSERVCVPASLAFHLPKRLSVEEGAAIPVNYATARLMLVDMARAEAGETVLVHGLGGGVGIAAFQVARALGLEVIGTASGGKHARLAAMGAERLIDYRTEDFERSVLEMTGGRGVDIVLDPLGGRAFAQSYRSLAPFGRVIAYGISSLAGGGVLRRGREALASVLGPAYHFHPFRLMNDNRAVMGFNLGHLWQETKRLQRCVRSIVEGVEAGELNPVVDRVFPLAQAGEAHRYIEQRQNFGKVVLAP